ncbi:MAG: prenyltransferase/squalene oxidase repeat-containing protein [Planctomycetota bacterium]
MDRATNRRMVAQVRSACAAGLAFLTTLFSSHLSVGAQPGNVPEPTHPNTARLLEEAPRPEAVPQPPREKIEAAIDRGVAFLLKSQNSSGSWGAHNAARPYEVYAPIPGSPHAFQAATTALAVAALIEVAGEDPEVRKAIARAEAWMLENLPKLRRASPDVMYNVWGHSYSLLALSKLLEYPPDDPERLERLRELMQQQVGMLVRYEVVDGGWAYYDFVAQTQKPSGSSISFTTATALIGLLHAQRAGIEVPQNVIDRARASVLRQRKPDFSYLYGEYLKYVPMHPVNRPGGSLGRSQACNLAMRLWGDKAVTDEVLTAWLDRLFARNLWLDMGRKRPIPHESWFAVAGYFFYYGHYYAALCIEQLPEEEQPFYQDHLAAILLNLQERDGSWWDFPMYGYHQQYGTAFALMSLKRTLRD